MTCQLNKRKKLSSLASSSTTTNLQLLLLLPHNKSKLSNSHRGIIPKLLSCQQALMAVKQKESISQVETWVSPTIKLRRCCLTRTTDSSRLLRWVQPWRTTTCTWSLTVPRSQTTISTKVHMNLVKPHQHLSREKTLNLKQIQELKILSGKLMNLIKMAKRESQTFFSMTTSTAKSSEFGATTTWTDLELSTRLKHAPSWMNCWSRMELKIQVGSIRIDSLQISWMRMETQMSLRKQRWLAS